MVRQGKTRKHGPSTTTARIAKAKTQKPNTRTNKHQTKKTMKGGWVADGIETWTTNHINNYGKNKKTGKLTNEQLVKDYKDIKRKINKTKTRKNIFCNSISINDRKIKNTFGCQFGNPVIANPIVEEINMKRNELYNSSDSSKNIVPLPIYASVTHSPNNKSRSGSTSRGTSRKSIKIATPQTTNTEVQYASIVKNKLIQKLQKIRNCLGTPTNTNNPDLCDDTKLRGMTIDELKQLITNAQPKEAVCSANISAQQDPDEVGNPFF